MHGYNKTDVINVNNNQCISFELSKETNSVCDPHNLVSLQRRFDSGLQLSEITCNTQPLISMGSDVHRDISS